MTISVDKELMLGLIRLLIVQTSVEIFFTPLPVTKYEIMKSSKAESYTESYDVVVCSGGDGTLDEVVTAMARRKDPVPIGYIPTGTTNDFANSLHISKDLLEAADTAANGVPFPSFYS